MRKSALIMPTSYSGPMLMGTHNMFAAAIFVYFLLLVGTSSAEDISEDSMKERSRRGDQTDVFATMEADTFSRESPLLFEGDIVADPEDIMELYGPQTSDVKIQKVSPTRRWPNAIVYFEISSGFQSRGRRIILSAMREYEEKTCIRFKETSDLGKRRLFLASNERGCWSYVGKNVDNRNRQTISLGKGCLHHRIVLHELGHALGLWHEQSRPDRDRYITVHRENVQPRALRNFDVRRLSDYHGEQYDFASIMHYDTQAFSRNGLNTISVHDDVLYHLQDKPRLGQRQHLSDIDARQINKHYGCYVPESGPGSLHVRVLEAGPFQEPDRYYVCVRATDSRGNRRQRCSDRDGVSTTSPEWDEELVFDPVHPDAMFHSFEVRIMQPRFAGRDWPVVERQTIWVESNEHHDSFCATKSLCVSYQYRLVV